MIPDLTAHSASPPGLQTLSMLFFCAAWLLMLNSYVETLALKDYGIRRWDLWEVLRSEGGAHTNGISGLIKEAPRDPRPLLPCEYTEEVSS